MEPTPSSILPIVISRRPFLLLCATMLSGLRFPVSAFADDAAPAPEKVSLWSNHAPVGDGTFQNADPSITVHRAAKPNGAAMVICPGGGYSGLVVGAEGHGIAAWLNQHGITGVVLEYRLPHGNAHVPLLDAQRAIRITRSRAKEWGIDPHRIGIIGFSAGGHVASTAATHFDAGNPAAPDPIDRVSSRPDFVGLVYPVISMGEKGHAGSRKNLLGANPAPGLVDEFSNEKRVTKETPPTYLAHAQDDKVVPIENSQMFYDALLKNHVPAKFVKLASGGHGLNHYQGPMWDQWQTEFIAWLVSEKIIPAE
jgi:acetyl esterase/lipase